MSQTQPILNQDQQKSSLLELAIANLTNASRSEFIEAIQQLPAEKRPELVVNENLSSSFADKVEILRQMPLEETGEITQAIAQVWQEAD